VGKGVELRQAVANGVELRQVVANGAVVGQPPARGTGHDGLLHPLSHARTLDPGPPHALPLSFD
jgi:hypothetical protein